MVLLLLFIINYANVYHHKKIRSNIRALTLCYPYNKAYAVIKMGVKGEEKKNKILYNGLISSKNA